MQYETDKKFHQPLTRSSLLLLFNISPSPYHSDITAKRRLFVFVFAILCANSFTLLFTVKYIFYSILTLVLLTQCLAKAILPCT